MNLLKDNVPSLVKKLALPAMVGTLFQTLYNIVDTFFAGKISAEALAERGLAPDPIAHLEGGNFSNNPTDEITDYIEMQWAEFTAGG